MRRFDLLNALSGLMIALAVFTGALLCLEFTSGEVVAATGAYNSCLPPATCVNGTGGCNGCTSTGQKGVCAAGTAGCVGGSVCTGTYTNKKYPCSCQFGAC